MDFIDEKILKRVERQFPISSCPYQDLAGEFGLSEEEVISRIARLKKKGVIKRIGALFDSEKLGLKSTLVAMKVPQPRLEEVANIVNCYPGVTHNYSREHEFNLWFVLMGKDDEEIDHILKKIEYRSGIKDILNLPKKQLFKLNLHFTREEE